MFEILGAILFGAVLEFVIKYWWQLILGYILFAIIFWTPFLIMERNVKN